MYIVTNRVLEELSNNNRNGRVFLQITPKLKLEILNHKISLSHFDIFHNLISFPRKIIYQKLENCFMWEDRSFCTKCIQCYMEIWRNRYGHNIWRSGANPKILHYNNLDIFMAVGLLRMNRQKIDMPLAKWPL